MSDPPIRPCPAGCDVIIRGDRALAAHATAFHRDEVDQLIENHPDELLELIAT